MGKEVKIALNKINWLHSFEGKEKETVVPFIYNEDKTKIKDLLTEQITFIAEDFTTQKTVDDIDLLGNYDAKKFQKHSSAFMLTHYSVGIMPFVTSKTIRGLYYITEEELPEYCARTELSRKEIAKLADIFSTNVARRIREKETAENNKEEQDNTYKF